MKRIISTIVVSAVLFTGCGNVTAGVAVAAVGIAGAALSTYCITGGGGCSPGLIAYGALITTEASKDAVILMSGSSTVAQINGIVANLTTDLQNGQALIGLTGSQQIEVNAILSAVTVLLPLVEALLPKGAVAPRATTSVTLPHLTSKDHAKLDEMKTAIAAVPKR